MTDDEITQIADKCGMYECHDNGRINGSTVLDFARAILAAAPVAQQEPVEYQVRTRPMWRDEGEGWTEWRKCSPESYADYVRVPVLHDWQHEARALYAAPVTQQETQSGEMKCNTN